MTLDTPTSDASVAATHRTVWALGDYALMAEEVMAPLGPALVEATGIRPGLRVLDVAAGSGNISLPAAATGAAVVSTDLTPDLLRRSQARAEARGLTIDYREANAQALGRWVEGAAWIDHLAPDAATRSNTSVCLKIADARFASNPDVPKKIAALLEKEGVAFDIGGYRDAPPGLRIWCGATVDASDIEALGPWLDWAFAEVTGSSST